MVDPYRWRIASSYRVLHIELSYNKLMKRAVVWAFITTLLGVGAFTVQAATFTSPNFSINSSIGDSIAGSQSSTNYQLVSTGGQSIAGKAESESYKLGEGYGAQLENSFELRVQPNGLIGHYSFDQASGGTIVDDSVNANTATFTGTPTWTTGKLNGGLNGFSSSDYASVNADSTYNLSAITACVWMNLTNFSSNPVALSRSLGSPNTNGMWSIGFNGGSTPRVRMYANGTNNVLLNPSSVGTDTWSHVCLTYDGGDFIMYTNGQEVDRVALNDPMASFSTPLRIGVISSGSQPLQGIVDEAKIYSRVLNAQEIEAEYDAQNSGFSSGVAFQDSVTPGESQTSAFDTIIQTSAPGYTLAINQNGDLTSGSNTIPGVSGSIVSPVVWSEGSTKGLGFTLYGTNATALPGTWNSGNSYAALPGTGTSFYTRTNYNAGAKDIVNMRLRLDAALSQVEGEYTNQMIISGTMTP